MHSLPKVPTTVNSPTTTTRNVFSSNLSEQKTVPYATRENAFRQTLVSVPRRRRGGVASKHANQDEVLSENLSHHTDQQKHSYANPQAQQNVRLEQALQAGKVLEAHFCPNPKTPHSKRNQTEQHSAIARVQDHDQAHHQPVRRARNLRIIRRLRHTMQNPGSHPSGPSNKLKTVPLSAKGMRRDQTAETQAARNFMKQPTTKT